MNKGYFISSIALLWLCCSVNISHACNLPPVVTISNSPKYTAVDVGVGFDGFSSDEDGYIVDWRWTFPPEAYDFYYDHLWEVSCKFNATGIYTVTLEVEDNMGATDSFNCTVYVIAVYLNANSAYIQVNTDDDNENSIQDRYEFETVDDEDDLVEITLSMTPDMDHGDIRLEAGLIVGTLSVWGETNKATKLINPHDPDPTTEVTWNVTGPFSKTLWVEGCHVDNIYPTGCLGLSFLHPTQGHTIDLDVAEIRPVEVRLFMDGVNEDKEEFPGNYILYNKDDDNDNGVPDYDDTENTAEDDLVRIIPHLVEPHDCPYAPEYNISGTVTFNVISGASKVKVWQPHPYYPTVNILKFAQISFSSPPVYATPGDLPKVFYVEGIEPSDGPRDVVFTLTYNELGFKDTVRVTVVHVEPFRDEDYTQPLDDWPKIPGEDLLRSPKYLFGEDDPVYVQVKNIGKDPDEAENFDAAVVVKSQTSGYIYMDLQETGVDTEIFRNSIAQRGELLYLSTVDVDDYPSTMDPDKIKVISEEVLDFWLAIPPGSVAYKKSEDVMVDRAEIGVEWQNQYDPYCEHYLSIDSNYFSQGLYDNMGGEPNLVWFKNFDWHDLDSSKADWSAVTDAAYADSVDFTAWTGHSKHGIFGENRPMHFFSSGPHCTTLILTEMNLGDTDADWVVIYSCSSLQGNKTDLKTALLNDERCPHLFCGFTTADEYPYLEKSDAGQHFANMLKDMTIKEAWFDHCQNKLRIGAKARVFGAEDCMDDSVAGPGPIEVTRDPTSSDTWKIEDFEKKF